MKLVDIGTGCHYINMDYISSVYIKGDDFFIELIGQKDDYYVITEEAYNDILAYGKANKV